MTRNSIPVPWGEVVIAILTIAALFALCAWLVALARRRTARNLH